MHLFEGATTMKSFNKEYPTLGDLFSLTRMLFLVSVLFSALLSFRTISSLDYGIHVSTGRWILANNRVPETDPFSWSFSDHRYLAYHWGFQVIVAKLEHILGLAGPIIFRCLVIGLTTAMLLWHLVLKKVSPALGTLCVFLALLMLDSRMLIRPELFSYLLLASIALIIEFRRKHHILVLLALPLLFLVWINTHIYLFGIFVVACALIESIVKLKPDKLLGLAAILSLPVLFFNPYGLDAILEPLHLLTRLDHANPFKHTISELHSPIEYLVKTDGNIVFDRSLLGWLIFTLLLPASLWGLLKEKEWAGIGILLVFWLLSVSAFRNIGLLAVAGLPHMASGLRRFIQRDRMLSKIAEHPNARYLAAAVILVASLRVITGAWYLSNRSPVRLGVDYESGKIPVRAASFVENHNLKGYGFNTLNAGGALLLNAPSHKVFIDGRNEVTNEDFLIQYLSISDPKKFQHFADESNIEYCVITHQDSIKLTRMLIKSQVWKLVYYDESAIIVVKRHGLNQQTPEVFLGFETPIPLRREILNSIVVKAGLVDALKRWLVSTERLNTTQFDIGSFLIRAGFPQQAEIHLLQAVSTSPHLWEVWSNLGALYLRLGMWGDAALAYKTVLMLNPNSHGALLRARESQLQANHSDFDKFRIVPL